MLQDVLVRIVGLFERTGKVGIPHIESATSQVGGGVQTLVIRTPEHMIHRFHSPGFLPTGVVQLIIAARPDVRPAMPVD